MKVDFWDSTKLNNWKNIQPRILLKRTLKKTRNLMNSETFLQKKKKEKTNTQIQRTLKHFYKTKKEKRNEKYSDSKNFISRTLSQISSSKSH